MKIRCLLLLMFNGLLLLPGCSPRQSYFHDYVKQTFYKDAKVQPVWATTMGVHEYDGMWPEYSEQSMRQYFDDAKLMLDSLMRYDTTGWSIDDRVDYRSEIADLKLVLRDSRINPEWLKSSDFYMKTIYWGLRSVMLSNELTFDEKQEALISRIAQIPQFLETAGQNLTSSSETDLYCTSLGGDVVSEYIKAYTEVLIDSLPSRNAEISTIRDKALIAINDFNNLLETEILDYNLDIKYSGSEDIDFYLNEYMLFDFDSDSLIILAEKDFSQCDSLYRYYLALIPGEEYSPRWNDGYSEWPTNSEARAYYHHEIKQILKFLKDEHILDVPDIFANINFQNIPDYIKHLGYSTNSFSILSPLETKSKPTYFISPDLCKSSEDSAVCGIEENPWVRIEILENIIPGEYYQHYLALKNKSLTRNIEEFWALKDGWIIYVKELMYQRGFFENNYKPFADLYKSLRELALTVIIETGINTGRFDSESAHAFIESKLGSSGAKEFRRSNFCSQAFLGFHVSKFLGRLMIIQMREKARAMEGDNFDLADFHEKLLSEGNIPLPLIAWKYGWE